MPARELKITYVAIGFYCIMLVERIKQKIMLFFLVLRLNTYAGEKQNRQEGLKTEEQ